MQSFTSFSAVCLTASLLVLSAFTLDKGIDVGDKVPLSANSLKSTSGKIVTLDKTMQENGLLVIFSCNTCPFVLACKSRYKKLQKFCAENAIGLIAINSNVNQRTGVDSYDAMKKFAMENGYDFPYVIDKNAALANAFGATRTPEVYLFNSKGFLVYEGAIDDSHRSAEAVSKRYLTNAMQNMLSNKPINPTKTRSIGCTIKKD